jgi:hypothetical protein
MLTLYAGPGRLRTQALNTRAAFNRYVAWDEADGRPFVDRDIESDVLLGANTLIVNVDVVVLDPHGVSGRIVLWDLYGCTGPQAGLLAAPTCTALEQAYGTGRVAGVEVWDLRGKQRWAVARHVAVSWETAASAQLAHIASS